MAVTAVAAGRESPGGRAACKVMAMALQQWEEETRAGAAGVGRYME